MQRTKWSALATHRRFEQPLGVGMRGVLQHRADGARFHDLSRVHDGDSCGDLGRDPGVVRDEQDGHAEFLLQTAQLQQDLHLHRDIERRRRLVGEQDARFAGERERDHRAFPQTSRHLVRVGIHAPGDRWNLDPFEPFAREMSDAVMAMRSTDSACASGCTARTRKAAASARPKAFIGILQTFLRLRANSKSSSGVVRVFLMNPCSASRCSW